MARPKGSRTTLIAVNFDTLGRLSGLTGNTVRQYAQRGQFNPRDLDSALTWVNSRRRANGQPLIGLPTDEAVSDEDSEAVTRETPLCPPTRTSRGLFYDPLTASYRYDT